MFRTILALVALAAPALADAAILAGNPNLRLDVDRPQRDLEEGEVVLTSVYMHACAGGYTSYSVAQTIDPADNFTLAISAGDYCGVTFNWGSTMALWGHNTAGYYELSY